MNEVIRCILIIVIIAVVCGGAGYLIGARRIDVNARLVDQLNDDIAELERTNRKLESLSEERGRIIGFQRNSNKQLRGYNDELGDLNKQLRDEQQRRDGIIERLESDNNELTEYVGRIRDTLLEIAGRAGIDVHIDNSH